ncbi:putative 3-demethylubiquinone-9 3-methyltransferase (glyoxalase superfamily) [Rhodococcus sp. PvR044]|jgi:predicted 3-demethylubiquinone-9 3-methyltransferase (glyoxalase superfamily)|uniref:VOC family protein n=1 Tax=Rhodococcus TaxID=1827 RepID=UPI000BD6D3E0|nr:MULTISPECIES: VOC family protein [Rhodococcus]MBP1161238.1 putative 3-demethylubiquinone-9 3-methyltransferase (glyoxalase superfamily) [Rhodococcus sp. PvR099]MCZ4559034.1 VOC family protein [Rhodococcus maanshanensis]PTR44817.1 putative 3-demethylubiquinone-9 3-methyltransferase (glyoxalase superfamily) [Rhodococcus sp. OK611]SNX93862.1 Glyoxalase superfamily enzyme, possibly 3-demethylubiquinone-9 3-methyltransferase [Rhodococcus sp. OK270]
MQIYPSLWFDDQAEEAANYYVSIFKNSKILTIARYPAGAPGPEGSVMTVDFELNGHRINAINGGPQFTFTEAVSLLVDCDSQEEVDEYWAKLTADGGQEVQCGWLKDKYGLSWQIVPPGFDEMMVTGDPEKSQRAMQAMMQMKKLDVNELRRAYNGE